MSAAEAPGELLLSRERLAALSGFTEAEVDECEQAGVIHKTDGGYRGVELVKLQIVRQVAEQHGGLDRVLEKYYEGGYSLNLLEIALPAAQKLSTLTYAELRDRLGIPAEEIHSVYRAAGLPLPDPNQPARIDEIEAFENYAVIRTLPIPADARLHALRVTGDSLRRAAEVQSQLFREHVLHPLLERFRDDPQQANALISEISSRANPTVTAVTGWLFQRYLEHQTLKNATELMEEAVGDGEIGSHRAGDPTVVFVDLVGFTVLSADLGDTAAAELAAKFNDQLMDTSLEHDGRLIKTWGTAPGSSSRALPTPRSPRSTSWSGCPARDCRRCGSAFIAGRWWRSQATTTATPSTWPPGSPTMPGPTRSWSPPLCSPSPSMGWSRRRSARSPSRA